MKNIFFNFMELYGDYLIFDENKGRRDTDISYFLLGKAPIKMRNSYPK
jgi:hypothetical protein